MKIRILFYKAKFEFRSFLKTRRIHLVDDLISAWTWPANIGTPPYSHVEVQLPDADGNFEKRVPCKYWEGTMRYDEEDYHYTEYLGTAYTSTMRDGGKGTCKRPASEVLTHLERWDYCEIDIPEDDYYTAKAWAEIEVDNNKGYDMKAIWSFLLPWRFHNPTQNICEEFVHNFAYRARIFNDACTVHSPRRFARMLVRAGHKIESLI